MPQSLETMDAERLYDTVSQGLIPANKRGSNEVTILLIGEAGTKVTGMVSLMANILQGTWLLPYVDINGPVGLEGDLTDEDHHRTNGTALYTYKTQSLLKYNILDASGLVEIHGSNADNLGVEDVAKAIKDKVPFVNAIFVVLDGTHPTLGSPIVNALSTLSSMFSDPLLNNTCFLFTNIADKQTINFDEDSIPEPFRSSPKYYLDNPILRLIEPRKAGVIFDKARRQEWDESVDNHKEIVGVAADIFKWMEKLSPQPVKDIISLYKQSQEIEKRITDALAAVTQIVKQEPPKVVKKTIDETNPFGQYGLTNTHDIWRLVDQDYYTTSCMVPGCYRNCHEHCDLHFSLNPEKYRACWAFGEGIPSAVKSCRGCGHGHTQHRQFSARWEPRKNDVFVATDETYVSALLEAQQAEEQKLRDNLVSQVGRLVGEYTELPMPGYFAGHLKQSVGLLEINVRAVCENTTNGDIVQPLEKALDKLKQKLAVVEQTVDKESIGHNRSVYVRQGVE